MAHQTSEQKTAIKMAKEAAARRRMLFTDDVNRNLGRLADEGIPLAPLKVLTKLPASAVWKGNDDTTISALVAGGEPQKNVDLALVYGLAHANGRHLRLVLPEGTEAATLIRAAFLRAPISVYTHNWQPPTPADHTAAQENGLSITLAEDSSRADAELHVREIKGLRRRATNLEGMSDWVEELREWAEDRAALSPAHRGSYLAWHAYGMLVLKVGRKEDGGLRITAGIHYTAPGKEPHTLDLIGPLPDNGLAATIAAVEDGIDAAREHEAGPHKEHLLQENLARQRDNLGWPDPVLREFPALRPGGGIGFIDFLRTERDGTLHIVETKIGRDRFVVLQGLDYWIWAQANADLLLEYFARKRNINLRDVRDCVVDYVLGDESGAGKNILSGYAATHLHHLPEEMRWRFHRAHPIDSGHVRLESLSERETPVPTWCSPKL